MKAEGVYFLSNDTMLDLTIAFLNSFRVHNPDVPLCFIPFDDNISEIRKLSIAYKFSTFSDSTKLSYCDAISCKFHPKITGQYRKLVCWDGCFDPFIYIDVDSVVLEDVTFAFNFLEKYNFITSHSDLDILKQWVWKASIDTAGILSKDEIAFSANTGFIVSNAQSLTWEQVDALMPLALSLSDHMELLCAEQPLLNLLIVRSGKPYTSLLKIARLEQRLDIPLERHSAAWHGRSLEGRLIEPMQSKTLLIHWAGDWRRKTYEASDIWQYYRNLR